MPLDEKGRKKRAAKAGKASGKARYPKSMSELDNNMVLAYDWLSGNPQNKLEMIAAIEFLNKAVGSCKLQTFCTSSDLI